MIFEQKFQLVEQAAREISARDNTPFVASHPPKFNSNSTTTETIRLVNGGAGVEKVIVGNPNSHGGNWINEVLFYIFARAHALTPDIYIPQLTNLHVLSRSKISLTLEYVEGSTLITGYDLRQKLAGAFATLGAQTHKSVNDPSLDWLPSGVGIGPRNAISPIEKLQTLCTLAGRPEAWKTLDVFIEQGEAVRAAHKQGYTALCHGDANHTNIALGGASGRPFIAFDWARVQKGKLGDDLVRVIYPKTLLELRPQSLSELEQIENAFLMEYLAGMRAIMPQVDEARVIACYHIRSVVFLLGISGMLANWLETASQDQIRPRENVVRSYIALISQRADSLVTQIENG